MTILYDPPSGWKFGFPKKYEPSNPLEPIEHTLRRDGYSDELLAQGMAKHCRFWDVDPPAAAIPGHLDSVARRYVEHYTTAQETFGQIKGMLVCDGPMRFVANDNLRTVADATRRKGTYITTYTGRFHPFDPNPEDVNIEDIAHSLSMQCRYAGHGSRFYSVAEHSVHLARWCMRFGAHTALTALLHDATEAYLVDVPRPVKAHLAGYKDAEAAVWKAIAAKFDLDIELPSVVHAADGRICADEMSQNLHEVDPSVGPPLRVALEFWMPWAAELCFLDMFKKLTAEIENMRAAA